MRYGWDDEETAVYYESFCQSHSRYSYANEALVAAAEIVATPMGMRVLDVGAGTGRTSWWMPEGVRLTCVEPSAAMRRIGMARLPEARWLEALPPGRAMFDVILSGAAIWQMLPLETTLDVLELLLAPGGRLVFNIPSVYLGEPDAPGGGRDPYLLELLERLPRATAEVGVFQAVPPAAIVDRLLRARGLTPARWQMRARLSQREYCDWLKIPVLSNQLFPNMDAAERAVRLDEAFAKCDADSWRWESWTGWIARKDPGVLLVRGVIDAVLVNEVRDLALSICRAEGWLDSEDTVAVSGLPPLDPAILRVQGQLQSSPAFARLRRAPQLLDVLAGVLDGGVDDRQGDVWRIIFPDRPEFTTGPHTDASFMSAERQREKIWTAWIPLTDCPVELGPLAVRDCVGEWIPQPMQAGDALLLDSHTMHRALDNRCVGRLRLSVDLRYRRV